MRFTVEGREYDFDADRLSVGEAQLVHRHTGMGVKSWLVGINDYQPDAWLALVLVAKKRNGEAVTWNDLQNLDFLEICNSHQAAVAEELQRRIADLQRPSDDHGEPPGPTKPAKKAPARKAARKTPGKTRRAE